MRTRIVVGLWILSAATAGVAVTSAWSNRGPGGIPSGPADRAEEAGRRVTRAATLERQQEELVRREFEEMARQERIKAGELMTTPLPEALRDPDSLVDRINAMTDLSESVRQAIIVIKFRSLERMGVRDFIIREQVPRIREQLEGAGIEKAAAEAAAISLVDPLLARRGRQLDIFEEVAATDATGDGMIAAHHSLETAYRKSALDQVRERIGETVGPERSDAAVRAVGGFFYELAPIGAFEDVTSLLPREAGETYLDRLSEELDRQMKAGQASMGPQNRDLFLTQEGVEAIRGLLASARAYLPACDQDYFDHQLKQILDQGLALNRGLQQMVNGLRRLKEK